MAFWNSGDPEGTEHLASLYLPVLSIAAVGLPSFYLALIFGSDGRFLLVWLAAMVMAGVAIRAYCTHTEGMNTLLAVGLNLLLPLAMALTGLWGHFPELAVQGGMLALFATIAWLALGIVTESSGSLLIPRRPYMVTKIRITSPYIDSERRDPPEIRRTPGVSLIALTAIGGCLIFLLGEGMASELGNIPPLPFAIPFFLAILALFSVGNLIKTMHYAPGRAIRITADVAPRWLRLLAITLLVAGLLATLLPKKPLTALGELFHRIAAIPLFEDTRPPRTNRTDPPGKIQIPRNTPPRAEPSHNPPGANNSRPGDNGRPSASPQPGGQGSPKPNPANPSPNGQGTPQPNSPGNEHGQSGNPGKAPPNGGGQPKPASPGGKSGNPGTTSPGPHVPSPVAPAIPRLNPPGNQPRVTTPNPNIPFPNGQGTPKPNGQGNQSGKPGIVGPGPTIPSPNAPWLPKPNTQGNKPGQSGNPGIASPNGQGTPKTGGQGSKPGGQAGKPSGPGSKPGGQGNNPGGQGNMPGTQGNTPGGRTAKPGSPGNEPDGQGNSGGGKQPESPHYNPPNPFDSPFLQPWKSLPGFNRQNPFLPPYNPGIPNRPGNSPNVPGGGRPQPGSPDRPGVTPNAPGSGNSSQPPAADHPGVTPNVPGVSPGSPPRPDASPNASGGGEVARPSWPALNHERPKPPPDPNKPQFPWWLVAAGCAVGLLLVGLGLWVWRRRRPEEEETPVVASNPRTWFDPRERDILRRMRENDPFADPFKEGDDRSPAEICTEVYRSVAAYLWLLGFERKSTQTDLDFAHWLSRNSSLPGKAIQSVMKGCARAHFSPSPLTDEEMTAIRNPYCTLVAAILAAAPEETMRSKKRTYRRRLAEREFVLA